jgi:TldD protein
MMARSSRDVLPSHRWLGALVGLLCLLAPAPALAAEVNPSTVLSAIKDELARSLKTLQGQPEPPYFLSYEITEAHRVSVEGAFGTLTGSDETRSRLLDIDLRVGSHDMDNTRQIRGGFDMGFLDRYSMIPIPIEDNPDAIRGILWYETDKKYKRAIENLTKVRTNVQVKVDQEDQSADFSHETPSTYREEIVDIDVDRSVWEDRVKRYTAPFAKHGDIYGAEASFTASSQSRWFLNSEGSEIQTSRTLYRLFLSAFTKADDGMELPRYESFLSFTEDGLPGEKIVMAAVETMIQDLLALREAPVVDPYIGPAILSGRASGVFFHEVFGHRIEGHRQKSEDEGQTFKKMIGEQLLPESFSVVFDPTVAHIADTDLAGFYRYDNQGAKARPVPVIEDGIFKSFLMSRAPVDGFPSSNGHGRKQAGFMPVARQSNLIVEVKDAVSRDELKKELLALVEKESKPFGLLFDDIQGGFTMTGRTIPNAFNVLPILVYRVFPDGREELVRGVDLIGTPLTAFRSILKADDEMAVFNGTCGAESGGVPVSAVSPALLLSQIEVQKKDKSQDRPPILPAPLENPPIEQGSGR